MRFTADHGWAVIEGRKTTHRIPVTPLRYDVDALIPLQFPNVETDSYGQPIRDARTGEPCRTLSRQEKLRVLSVDKQRLGLIEGDMPALRAEGYVALCDFARNWMARHDPNRDMRDAVQRDPAAVDGITDENVLEHWRARHAHKTCLVISFRVELPDTIRHLASQNGMREPTTFTSRAEQSIDLDAEGVDAPQSAVIEAQQRWVRAQADKERRYTEMSLGERIDHGLARAREQGIDVSSVERLIHQKTIQLERRNDRAA